MNPVRNQNIKLDKKPEDKKEVGLLISNGVNKNKILLAISIVLLGTLSRIFLNELIAIPNFEMITALSLVSGSFLRGIFAPLLPLLMIFLSDIYFSNTIIYLFTWSAFVLIGIFGVVFKRNSKHYFVKITGGGIISVLFFYLWTNFGWWLTSGMYSMNFKGLVDSYIAAIPFLRNQLISVLIFTPIFSLIFTLIFEKLLVKKSKKHDPVRNSAYKLDF